MMTVRTFFTVLILLIVAGVGIAGVYMITRQEEAAVLPEVLSFADCEAAGYPVMESYPRQCMTPDGRTFAEEPTQEELTALIAYENASADMIVITNPTPGAVTGKEFTVMGEARGNWYFEASFPIEVVSATGTVIATGIAEAQSDWMTTEFVPFTADIKVPESYIGEATLILRNDNASGLPENARSASFPFTIEY